MESGRRSEFESKLADTMQRLRQDHDLQVQQYKEELERNFATKVQAYECKSIIQKCTSRRLAGLSKINSGDDQEFHTGNPTQEMSYIRCIPTYWRYSVFSRRGLVTGKSVGDGLGL